MKRALDKKTKKLVEEDAVSVIVIAAVVRTSRQEYILYNTLFLPAMECFSVITVNYYKETN